MEGAEEEIDAIAMRMCCNASTCQNAHGPNSDGLCLRSGYFDAAIKAAEDAASAAIEAALRLAASDKESIKRNDTMSQREAHKGTQDGAETAPKEHE